MLPGRRSAYVALFSLVFVSKAISVVAQGPVEAQHKEVPRERTANPESTQDEELRRETKREFRVHVPARATLLTGEEAEAFKQPQTLRWENTQDATGRPVVQATTSLSSFKSVDLGVLKQLLDGGGTFINEGTPPRSREWRELNAAYPDQIITHEPESANRDPQAVGEAVALGNRPLNPARVKIFNALPHETELQAHFQEQTRMGVGGTLEYWKGLHEDIQANSQTMLPHRATKEALLKELRSGTSDVLMLYAHFDDGLLYMPGAQGGTISIHELEQIDRTKDPSVRERVVVLVSCKTAARTTEDPRSLASVLLEKGIARTVMATDRPYDSRDIPALLKRLASGIPLREAVALPTQPSPSAATAQRPSYLQQFVELQVPAVFRRRQVVTQSE